MMTDPTQTARDVIRSPEVFGDRPATLAAAWAVLMMSRGKSVNMDRIGAPHHLIARRADGLCDALRRRIRARAERIGRTSPEPLILHPDHTGGAA